MFANNQAQIERQRHPHNPLHTELPAGSWAGQPCFIIAGGPSLTGFDFNRLKGKGKVIAINRALEFAPWADIAFFMDWKLYKLYHESPAKKAQWDAFTGRKVFLNLMGRMLNDCFSIRSLGRHGLSWDHGKGLYHGNNSGHGALNLAISLGAKPIYLLGYDCGFRKGERSHFHTGYGTRSNPNIGRSFIRDFEALKAYTKGRVNYIFNLNPNSALRIWPFKTADEVLNDGPTREGMGTNNGVVGTPGV